MEQHRAGWRSVDEYIAAFPADIQALLQTVRATIRAAAPDAEERISYQMPAQEKSVNSSAATPYKLTAAS